MSKVSYEEYKSAKNYASTGCLLLDLTVGGGKGLGFPFGWMVNIVGDKSAGKTFLAWEIIAACYHKFKKNLKWNYDESESGNTFDTEKLYGVDFIEHENHFNKVSNLVEEMDGNTSLFLKQMNSVKQKGIYVVDSLDGLSDEDKEKQSVKFEAIASGKKGKESGSYNTGTASHLSKQYFRTKTAKLKEKNVLLVIISQVREKLNAGLFEKKTYRAGGKAMDFYAHTCLWLFTLSKIVKNGKVIGVVVKAKADKSKTPRPYRECTFSMYFDYGIDNIGSCIDYLFDLRTPEGKLTAAANSIPWDKAGIEKNWTNIQEWIKEIGIYDSLRELKKEETGKKALSKEWVLNYIDADSELKEKAEDYFGSCIDRNDLIAMIEDDPKLYEELERRVIDKWETEEEAVQSNRKRKYS